MQRSVRTTILPFLALLLLLGAGCGGEPFETASLAGSIDVDAPPGPWRPAARPGIDPAWFAESRGLVVQREGAREPATRLVDATPEDLRSLIRSGALVQTAERSLLVLPLELRPGERVVFRIRYPRSRAEGSPGPRAVLLRVPGTREADTAAPTGEPCGEVITGVVPVPPGGAERIEVHHWQAPETPLKLLGIDVLVVDAAAAEAEVRRAAWFLEFGGSDNGLLFNGAALHRVVRVSRFGMTAHCAVLAPGEGLSLELPSRWPGNRLAFHAVRPPGETGNGAGISLELETGGARRELRRWLPGDVPAGEWSALEADLPRGGTGAGGRILLTNPGGQGALGVTVPVLLPAAGRAADRPNLVLVSLDTLRADRLGCYGYTVRPTSERLERTMADWGFAVFRRAFSASPWTIPGTAKFMASRYLDFHVERRVPDSTTMLAEVLRDSGYYCAAFTGGGMVAVRGMDQGFHEYHWSSGFGKVEGSFPQAGQWLEQWEGGPFFLFVHTYETHRPYTRDTYCRGLPRGRLGDLTAGERLTTAEANIAARFTAEEQAYVQAAYDGGVLRACEATADLLETLERTGRRRDTVVVILSDHGEELWDRHQLFGAHGHTLNREMLDVPLLLHCPATAGRGLRDIETPVSTVDLPPTAVDLLGVPWPGGADGVSLVPLLAGGTVEREVPIIADLQRSRIHPSVGPQACVIENGVKFIAPLSPDAPRKEGSLSSVVPPAVPGLFRLDRDPAEHENLADSEPGLAARMKERLHRAMALALQPETPGMGGSSPAGRPSEELSEQLRALGYIEN